MSARARRGAWVVAGLLFLTPFAIAVIGGEADRADPAFGATAERLGSAGSNRYAYWDVAVQTFAADPAVGAGAGGFAAAWLERRAFDESVRDAHSLLLETAAELGLVGLALLLLALGGVLAAALRAGRDDPALAAGPAAALAVWAAHAAIDWDWEMPALTLVAAVLAGFLLARGYHRAPS
jgi:O-antigen ligase